ncbi:MAG: precorrin-6y C5,15-methyltransferase (decarboxylating) subunit CbiE [Syntrophobacterales bacterium]|jgi:precorrin-6Y C5,15-methyltransferase (decarboxylating)
MSSVIVVGTGVGPDDLTEAHREAIDAAEILVGGRRQLEVFTGQSAAKRALGANPTATLEEVKQQFADKRVVILASGDPLFFGIGRKALQVFGSDNVVFLPNVTSLQKAFARLKLPWNEARTMSLHGREVTDFFTELSYPGLIAIYTDPENTPDRLARLFLEFGMANRQVAVVEEIGSEEERIRETDLFGAAEKRFAPLNVMILHPHDRQGPVTKLGLEDEHFLKEKSLITKQETRAVILAELRLEPAGVMWDVGAGSGSVGIEAVRIAPGLRVYAVERDQARLEMIQKNVQGLGAFGVKAVRGEAPEALTDLPDPDRVFIGGSGGRLIEILNLVEERFREEGRAVVSVATPETLGRAQTYLEKSHLAHEWRLLQVSRTVPIQPTKKRPESNLLSRFQSQTPLFILSLWRS